MSTSPKSKVRALSELFPPVFWLGVVFLFAGSLFSPGQLGEDLISSRLNASPLVAEVFSFGITVGLMIASVTCVVLFIGREIRLALTNRRAS